MPIHVRQLGRIDYLPTYEAMQAFTAARNTELIDLAFQYEVQQWLV